MRRIAGFGIGARRDIDRAAVLHPRERFRDARKRGITQCGGENNTRLWMQKPASETAFDFAIRMAAPIHIDINLRRRTAHLDIVPTGAAAGHVDRAGDIDDWLGAA